jgi:hypothetical protein
MGASDGEIVRALRTFTVSAEPFARAAEAVEQGLGAR